MESSALELSTITFYCASAALSTIKASLARWATKRQAVEYQTSTIGYSSHSEPTVVHMYNVYGNSTATLPWDRHRDLTRKKSPRPGSNSLP